MKSVSGKDFCKILEPNGWSLLRISGSHHIYGDSTGELRAVVPVHNNESLKRVLSRLLREAQLSESDL